MLTRTRILRWLLCGVVFAIVACGGGRIGLGPPGSGGSGAVPADPASCDCVSIEPDSADYRHAAKHVGLPGSSGQSITVATILSWPQGPPPAFDAPRSGRELQEFLVPHAWLQLAWVNPGDCDIHAEISDVASKTAPRVIVETPVDQEYCTARQNLQQQLAAHSFTLDSNSGELMTPLPVQVLGLAFEDFEHQRGSQYVATQWELHPAIVTVLPQ